MLLTSTRTLCSEPVDLAYRSQHYTPTLSDLVVERRTVMRHCAERDRRYIGRKKRAGPSYFRTGKSTCATVAKLVGSTGVNEEFEIALGAGEVAGAIGEDRKAGGLRGGAHAVDGIALEHRGGGELQ